MDIQNSTAAGAYQGVLPSRREDNPPPQPTAPQAAQPTEPAQRVEETPRAEIGSADSRTGSQVDTYA